MNFVKSIQKIEVNARVGREEGHRQFVHHRKTVGASALNQTYGKGQRSILARIVSADLVQANGLGLALCSAR
jgi:hypothetical protein